MLMYRRWAMLAMVAMAISSTGRIPLQAQDIGGLVPEVNQESRRDNITLSDSLKLLELQLAETRARLAAAAADENSAVARTIQRTGNKRRRRRLKKMAASVRRLEDVVSEQSRRLSEALRKISELERELAAANMKMQMLAADRENGVEADASTVSIAALLQAQSEKLDLAIGRLETLQKQSHVSSRQVAELPPKPVVRYESLTPAELFEQITKHRRDFDEATKRDFDEAMKRLKEIEGNFADSSKQPDAVREPTEVDAKEGAQQWPKE